MNGGGSYQQLEVLRQQLRVQSAPAAERVLHVYVRSGLRRKRTWKSSNNCSETKHTRATVFTSSFVSFFKAPSS
jgi:hypothetical protein